MLHWLVAGERTECYDAKVIYTLKTPLSCGYLGARASGPRDTVYGRNLSVGASNYSHLGCAGLWPVYGMDVCPLSFLRKYKVTDCCNHVGLVRNPKLHLLEAETKFGR